MRKNLFALIIAIVFFNSTFRLSAQNCATDSLVLLAQQNTAPYFPLAIVPDKLNRPYFYMAAKDGGVRIYQDSTVQSPTLVFTIPNSAFDSLEATNIVQEGIYLYVSLGNFFGSAVQKPGMAIIDVSNPANPMVTDFWEWPTVEKGTSSILVHGNYAYLGAMNNGVFILDISIKTSIQLVSHFIPDLNWPVVNPTAQQEPNTRGMAYRNDTLFIAYDAGGLRVFDVSNKITPVQVAQYLNPGSLNKQQAFNNIILDGGLAYIAEDYCGLEVVDISNCNNITQVGWWNPWGCETPSNIWLGSPGHTNQLVYDAALKIIYLSSGDSELRILDVSNPSLPDSCNGFGALGNQLGCWGVAVQNPYVYITYITTPVPFFSLWTGFKILSWPLISGFDKMNLQPNSIKLYPNPSSDNVYLEIAESNHGSDEISIFDMYGRCCFTAVIQSHHTKINISGLAKGIYSMRISSGNQSSVMKMIKQ